MTIDGKSMDLDLFLLQKDDGEWLDEASAITLAKNIQTPLTVEELQGFRPMNSWPLWLKSSKYFGTADEIHVLVVVPSGPVRCYGNFGSGGALDDDRILRRSALTNDLITRLDRTRVLLVNGPLMTGKSTLAALVSRDLVDRCKLRSEKAVIVKLSLAMMSEADNFQDAVRDHCNVEWSTLTGLSRDGYTVYFIVDETQILYKNLKSELWTLVGRVRRNENSRIRLLMFATYGWKMPSNRLAFDVLIPDQLVVDRDWLKFLPSEVEECVEKRFHDAKHLQNSQTQFCALVSALTGGHVGLCVTVIDYLNEVASSGKIRPSAQEWIQILSQALLNGNEGNALFKALISTRAVQVWHSLEEIEFERLKSILDQNCVEFYGATLDVCVRKGVLAQTLNAVEFSSPVMWRYFLKQCMATVPRTTHSPRSFPELIRRVIEALEYMTLPSGRSMETDISCERGWQMAICKVLHECTPIDHVISTDVGSLFASVNGYIDYSIESGDFLWGIELLHQADGLDGNANRIAPGGQSPVLELNDYGLIDFRRVSQVDDTTREIVVEDLKRNEKLYTVCIDRNLKRVSVFNSRFNWTFNRELKMS